MASGSLSPLTEECSHSSSEGFFICLAVLSTGQNLEPRSDGAQGAIHFFSVSAWHHQLPPGTVVHPGQELEKNFQGDTEPEQQLPRCSPQASEDSFISGKSSLGIQMEVAVARASAVSFLNGGSHTWLPGCSLVDGNVCTVIQFFQEAL